MNLRAPLIGTLLAVLSHCSALSGAWIWIEGESAAKTNIGKHSWYYGQVKKEHLSGGDFLAHYDRSHPGEAEYLFRVEQPGEYALWLRVNPVQSSLKYALNAGEPVAVDFSSNQTDLVNIAANNAPDLRFLAWCEIGKVALQAGQNRIRFITDSADSNHGAIDCFLLVQEPFQPSGALKPDQVAAKLAEVAAANRGWVPWSPPVDEFKESPIDLRVLNEGYAGERGRIQARGDRFVHERGGEVRFWAVNGPPRNMKGEALKRCARMLAKYGVNLVRIHSPVFESGTGTLKPEEVQRRLEIVEAMKKEGIYTHLSIYFPLWLTPEPGPGWREGYNGKQHPFALLYFEPDFQALYQDWWRAVLTTKNANGKTLMDEPALMGVELVNEDSFFFWTFKYENVPEPQMAKLEVRFGEWASRKYGSAGKALAAWQPVTHARDAAADGRLGFRPLYSMFREKTLRDQDTAAFLMETQMEFYDGMVKFLRSLGYKGLITASNWITANNEIFGPLERYTYTTGDFTDRHGYFGCNHRGDNAGWSIRNGHTYSNVSALRLDSEEPGTPKRFSHPSMDFMVNAKPTMLSETTWNRPNRFRSEAPLFYASYGALQDTDSIVHFALDTDRWQVKPSAFMQPWTLMSPSQIGQFPAAALIYRRGLVRPGDLLANLSLKLEEAVALKGSRLVQQANLDELRKADLLPGAGEASDIGIDPLVHLAGRTNLAIGKQSDKTEVKELAGLIDRQAQTVMSSTREILLDYGKGYLAINAPQAQGASGNLKDAGAVKLTDLTIQSELDLIHIIAVSLDGQPLAKSRKILLQAMTEEMSTNFQTEPVSDGVFRIKEVGTDPWLFREIQGSVKFRRADAESLKVTALDLNGYPAGSAGTAAQIRLQPDRVYYLIQ